jgi:hypothetical protein
MNSTTNGNFVFYVYAGIHAEGEESMSAPFCLMAMEIMYERSYVSGLSDCIPGEGVVDSMPNEEEDHVVELSSD